MFKGDLQIIINFNYCVFLKENNFHIKVERDDDNLSFIIDSLLYKYHKRNSKTSAANAIHYESFYMLAYLPGVKCVLNIKHGPFTIKENHMVSQYLSGKCDLQHSRS